MRQLFRLGELVDGTLGVIGVVIDDLGIARQLGIGLPKHLQNLLRVGVVFGKDDRLAQLGAVVDFQPVGHEDVEHLSDGVLVEHPLVQRGGGNAVRCLAVPAKGVLISRLVLLGQLVVHNALLQKFELRLHRQKVHQKPIRHRLGQLVAVGGHAALQLEYLVGVLVDLVLGGGSEAHQRRVKIGKNVPVFVVDGAVGLVADHQIEVPAGEQLARLVPHPVDAVHHGLVGGKYAVGPVVVLFLAQVGRRQVGQQVDKAPLSLGHQ